VLDPLLVSPEADHVALLGLMVDSNRVGSLA